MTHASGALQAAIHAALSAPGAVAAPVRDGAPPGAAPPVHVSIGPGTVTDASDASGSGSDHRPVVSVHAQTDGFAAAHAVAAQVRAALVAAPPVAGARVVAWGFVRAAARRDRAGDRRIDLTFRARLDDAPTS
ncbi:MAG: tail completion protein gp17 [Paracoccaceae bacterium]